MMNMIGEAKIKQLIPNGGSCWATQLKERMDRNNKTRQTTWPKKRQKNKKKMYKCGELAARKHYTNLKRKS